MLWCQCYVYCMSKLFANIGRGFHVISIFAIFQAHNSAGYLVAYSMPRITQNHGMLVYYQTPFAVRPEVCYGACWLEKL